MSLSFSIIPGRIISRWESHGAAGGPACYFRCLWKHQLGRLLGNQMIKRKVNGRAIDNECIMKVYLKLGSKHPYACMDKRPWIPLSSAMVIVKQTWKKNEHDDFWSFGSIFCCFNYRTRVRSLGMLVSNSLTHWLTDWLLFSKLDWCGPGVWRCQLKTSFKWWGLCW